MRFHCLGLLLVGALLRLEGSADTLGWTECEGWHEWACNFALESQQARRKVFEDGSAHVVNPSAREEVEMLQDLDIPVLVLQSGTLKTSQRSAILAAMLRSLGFANITLLPEVGEPDLVVKYMQTHEIDLRPKMLGPNGLSWEIIEAVNFIRMLREVANMAFDSFVLVRADAVVAWQSPASAAKVLRQALQDLPDDADVLLLDWTGEDCARIKCSSANPHLVRASAPQQFSALFGRGSAVDKIESFINPLWASLDEMLAHAFSGNMVVYSVKHPILRRSRLRVGDGESLNMTAANLICIAIPGCDLDTGLWTSTPQLSDQIGARTQAAESALASEEDIELEIIILYPPEGYVIPTTETTIEVLLRCRAAKFDCTKQRKLISFMINGETVHTANATIAASFGLVMPGGGEYEMSVRAQMGIVVQELQSWFVVEKDGKPDGHDRNMLTCPAAPVGSDGLCDTSNGSSCGAHGSCVRGVCICEADFVGDSCDVDLSSYHVPANSFLPSRDPAQDPTACARNEMRLAEAGRFREMVLDLYHRSSSELSSTQTPMLFENQISGMGLGAEILFAAAAMTAALREGRAARWTSPDSVYTRFASCDSGGLSAPMFTCFFRPLYSDNGLLCWQPNQTAPREDNKPLQQFPRLGSWFLLSEVLGLLARPQDRMAAAVRHLKQAIGFRPGLVGLHIRHGDSCFGDWCRSGACTPVPEFVAAVKQMAARYPAVTGLFLATDDEGVEEQVRELLPHMLVVTNHNADRATLGGKFSIAYRMMLGHVDRRYATESIVFDLALLADCSYLVGNLRSSVSRVALHLMGSRLGYVPPFISKHPR